MNSDFATLQACKSYQSSALVSRTGILASHMVSKPQRQCHLNPNRSHSELQTKGIRCRGHTNTKRQAPAQPPRSETSDRHSLRQAQKVTKERN